jgi:hypothetical protein
MTVTVVAHDDDTRNIVLTGLATDSGGGVSAPLTLTLQVSDPLSFSLTAPAGSGVTIVPVAGVPGTFTVSA